MASRSIRVAKETMKKNTATLLLVLLRILVFLISLQITICDIQTSNNKDDNKTSNVQAMCF